MAAPARIRSATQLPLGSAAVRARQRSLKKPAPDLALRGAGSCTAHPPGRLPAAFLLPPGDGPPPEAFFPNDDAGPGRKAPVVGACNPQEGGSRHGSLHCGRSGAAFARRSEGPLPAHVQRTGPGRPRQRRTPKSRRFADGDPIGDRTARAPALSRHGGSGALVAPAAATSSSRLPNRPSVGARRPRQYNTYRNQSGRLELKLLCISAAAN